MKSKLLILVFFVFLWMGFVFKNSIAFSKEKTSLISSKEFISSDFGRYFKKGEFKEALDVLDGLLKKYPHDPLILRYHALTLDKLGNHDAAVDAYKQILFQNPNHVPTHLFLGLAYGRSEKFEEATREFNWVIKNSHSEEYRHWAQAQLVRLRQTRERLAKQVKKKLYLIGKVGAAYDTNPLLIPDNKHLTSTARTPGMDFPFDISIGYPWVLKRNFRFDTLYIGNQMFHDGAASQINFSSQGVALDAKKRIFFGHRAVLLGGRYDLKFNFLRSDLFSVINRFLISLDTSFWRQTRTHFYTRFSYSNYGPDGSNPSVTSRDGYREGLGLIQYFYTTAKFTTYFFLKQEVSFAQIRGDNFDRVGSLSRLGVHALLNFLGPVDSDNSIGFDYGTYPEFSSLSRLDLTERRDKRLDFYQALTYHWKPNFGTRQFYRFIKSDNDNGFFDRKRHMVGLEVIFSL